MSLPVFEFGRRGVCTYCGDPGDSRDHVIAVSYQKNVRKRESECGPWCWACRSCNSKLCNRYFDSFKQRCEWIRDRIEMRVRPIDWSDAQVNSLQWELRDLVRRDVFKRRWMRMRADFYDSREFYLGIECLVWRVRPGFSEFISGYFESIVRDIKFRLYESH